MTTTREDWRRARIEAVARACARVRYPLSAEPAPNDLDYEDARRFVAMLEAEHAFVGGNPVPQEDVAPSETFAQTVGRLQREIGHRAMELECLIAPPRVVQIPIAAHPPEGGYIGLRRATPTEWPADWPRELARRESDVAGE